MNTQIRLLMSMVLCGVVSMFAACSTAPRTQDGRDSLEKESAGMLNRLNADDMSLKPMLNKSVGYALFPSVIKGGAGLGGAYGKGVLYSSSGTVVGFCDLSQGSIGFQLGGQEYAELIVFKDDAALERFKSGHFAFTAQATAVAASAGAAADADYANGVVVFTHAVSGLMFEAAVGGQNFSYLSK